MKLPVVEQITLQPADVIWDLAASPQDNRAILAELYATEERRSLLDLLRKEVPVANTCKAFAAAPYIRPTIHRRTIYLQLSDGGVFGIKGTEPHADDLREEVIHIESTRAPFYPSMLNEFALSEHKLPMAMSLDEAITEVETTRAFQNVYHKWFGRLARVPIHVLVYRWGDEIGERLLDAVRPSLCAIARRGTERILRRGLGAVLYYYPSLPSRASQQAYDKVALVSQIAGLDSKVSGLGLPFGTGIHERVGASFETRLRALQERGGPWQVVRSWVALLADMMFVGYFPFHTYYMGHCLQAQNLCIDGGLADTDSLQPMAELSDAKFHELFAQTLGELLKGCAVYITGTFVGRYPDQLIGATLWRLLQDELRARISERAPADPRLATLMRAPPLERLDMILRGTLRGGVPDNAPIVD